MPSHYPLIDAHTHLGSDSERSERQKKQILSLVCASTPPEAEALLKTAKPYLLPTAGLHPWQATSYFVNDMLPYLTACPVIGEIGMDSVWCDVPLDRQEEVFRAQLAIACQMKKPVILHTKGEEDPDRFHSPRIPNTYLSTGIPAKNIWINISPWLLFLHRTRRPLEPTRPHSRCPRPAEPHSHRDRWNGSRQMGIRSAGSA